jgi:tRNA(fMet)-specific endonuclease VapC
MILLDTDSFTLHLYGQQGFMERYQAASEPPAIAIVTQIEALRGRYDAVVKAENGARLLVARQGLLRTVGHLALFPVVPFDADLLIAAIALANKATLVTRNLKDFRLVPGLQLENWADWPQRKECP